MRTLPATYFDGQTSGKQEVTLHFDPPDQLRISGPNLNQTFRLSELNITRRVGNAPRSIHLPGGAKCEVEDNDTLDAILGGMGTGRRPSLLHRIEANLRYVLLAVAVTVVGVWLLIDFGLPALAKRVAYAVPESINTGLGREGLKLMDKRFFMPSALTNGRQDSLRSMFDEMTRDVTAGYEFSLEFRKSAAIGPNAFALPSGLIVATDDLIEIIEHDSELIAILAHEIGHVVHRHALRSVLQNSAIVLLVAGITGDITSITALSSTLPTLVIESKYSRAFERDADQYALRYLRDHDIPPAHFADILVRMEKSPGPEFDLPNYLSTHPQTSARIKAFNRIDD